MDILFITSSRIGDAVLSTGVLRFIADNHPKSRVTVACGPLVTSLFEGNPLVRRIIPLVKKKNHGHWLQLWTQVVGQHWDMVIDLRNSAVSRLIWADKRYIHGSHVDKTRHKVEQTAAIIGAQPPPAPILHFTKDQSEKATMLMGDTKETPVIGIGPAANWQGKTWPADRFIEITQWLISKGGFFDGARVAIFGAPGEEDICQQVLEAFPVDQRLDLIAKGTPGDAAAMLAKCDFYIGNDSGLMHAAAAAQVPSFGLFGPSYPHIYRPWGDHCDYARTPETFDELIAYDGYTPASAPCLMDSLTVKTVKEKLAAFLSHV